MTTEIKDLAELENFLTKYDSFEDGRCLSINPFPIEATDLPKSVRVELASIARVEGWDAGQEIEYEIVNIVAKSVLEFSVGGPPEPDHCMEGIGIVENLPNGLGIVFDVPDRVRIVCEQIDILSTRREKGKIRLHLSNPVSAKIAGASVPTPADWLAWLKAEGIDAAWRIHGLPIKPIEQVPEENYEGYYLIDPSNVDKSLTGVFFFTCRKNKEGISITIELKNSDETKVWKGLNKILSKLSTGEIRSGNCVFTPSEWGKYIESQELPERYKALLS